MKRYIFNLLFAFLLAVYVILPSAIPAQATTVVLTVASDGTYGVGTSSYVGAPATFANMNSNDALITTRTFTGEAWYTWKFTAMAAATINSVTLTSVISANEYSKAFVRIGGNNYMASGIHNIAGWQTWNDTWATNPSTGLAWTAAEINAAEFGINSYEYPSPSTVNVTYLYITVDYVSSPPVMTTEAVSALAATTATGNGTVVGSGGNVLTEKGIAVCLATHGTPDTGDLTFHDHIDSVGAYTEAIVGLVKGTEYHARAYAINAIGTGYGATVDFTTIGDPTVTTLAASLVSSTTARLNSQVTFDGKLGGGEPCTVTFVYAAGSGFANYAAVLGAPGSIETAVVGTYTVGQAPYLDITGLAITTTYSFSVKAINSTATTVYGAVATFTTESGVFTPTNLSAIPSSNTISLAWNKGVGASNTMVRYLTATYPTLITDGTLVYSNTGNSYVVTGLSPGTTYYFSVWGFTGAAFSATYITAVCTTSVTTENITVVPPSNYTAPTQWFQAPDYTRMSAFPLYDIINWGADQFQVPRSTSWFTIAIIFAMCIGILVYRMSTNIPASAISISMTIFICSMAGIMEMWLLVPFILIGVGAWVQGNRA